MPTPIPLTFWTARMTRPAGDAVLAPLLDPAVAWLGATEAEMADAFRAAAEKRFLERGRYSPLLRFSVPLKPEHRRLRCTVPAAKDRHLYPSFALELDAFETTLPDGHVMGFVPALAVEACARTPAELEKRLIEAVRLELARRHRLTSVRDLVAAQWYREVEVRPTTIELPFYSLAELRDLHARTFKRLLPDVATEFAPPRRRTVGLDAEVEQLSRALRGRYRRSVVVIGPSGVGKTALVEEYARTAPRKIWEVTAARLIQKLTRGDGWQKNLARFCTDLRDLGDLLYVRRFADLFEVGQYAGNALSVAEVLRPYIERGEITLLTECTPEQAARIDVRTPRYLALLHCVRLVEPQGGRLEKIVRERVEATAADERARVHGDAIAEALRLHRRYTPYSGLPGKTIRFLETILRDPRRLDERALTRRTALRQFCEDTGMPDFMVDPDLALPMERMEKHFHTNVFGQDEAVNTVIDLLAQVKTGLARSGKPIASLLFIGPTGVGKTELSKVLAEFMFGNRARMLRLDMSEFADVPSVMRLTGEAGLSRDGLLTGAVRQEPFSVVLFDEVEKAHPVFFDLLLQILGDGRLTDARGRLADFCSTIVVMTSNVGAATLPQVKLGFGDAGDRRAEVLEHFRREVEAFFRPELFNRLDRVVAFAPLDRGTVRRVVDREIRLVRARPGLRYRDIEVTVADGALDLLGEHGYDAAYGARQLQRAIREELVVPLAKQLNRYDGATALSASVGARGGKLVAQVRGLERPAVADRLVGTTGLSLKQVAEETSDERRRMQGVVEGSMVLDLRSRMEILERARRKRKERDWVKSTQARELELFASLARACDAAAADADWLEAEGLLALIDPDRAAPADLHALLADAQTRSWDAMVNLYDTLKPESRVCTLAIYGQDVPLRALARTYERIAKRFKASTATHAVWLLPEPERKEVRGPNRDQNATCHTCGAVLGLGVTRCWSCNTPLASKRERMDQLLAQPLDRKAPAGARLVGLEIEIQGPLAWLVFGDEVGKHVLRNEKGDRHEFIVHAGNCDHRAYEPSRPQEPHRQSFFKGDARRTIETTGFQDESWKTKSAQPDYESALVELLKTRLESELVRVLTE